MMNKMTGFLKYSWENFREIKKENINNKMWNFTHSLNFEISKAGVIIWIGDLFNTNCTYLRDSSHFTLFVIYRNWKINVWNVISAKKKKIIHYLVQNS